MLSICPQIETGSLDVNFNLIDYNMLWEHFAVEEKFEHTLHFRLKCPPPQATTDFRCDL